jgi:hypothetical protein
MLDMRQWSFSLMSAPKFAYGRIRPNLLGFLGFMGETEFLD